MPRVLASSLGDKGLAFSVFDYDLGGFASGDLCGLFWLGAGEVNAGIAPNSGESLGSLSQ